MRYAMMAGALACMAAACVSPEDMGKNLTDPAVGDGVSTAIGQFLSGNWIGGLVTIATVGSIVIFRKPAGRYIATAVRAAGAATQILVKTRSGSGGATPVPPGGPPTQSGGGGGVTTTPT